MKPLLTFATLNALLWPTTAMAHGVSLQYKPQQVIQVTARYDTGEPMARATVQVFAPNQPEQAVLQTSTNDQGEFQFIPDQAGYWQVQVRHGGHGGSLTIPVTFEAAPTAVVEATVPQPPVSLSQYTPLQISIMVLAVLWGAIGTACFAWSRRRVQVP